LNLSKISISSKLVRLIKIAKNNRINIIFFKKTKNFESNIEKNNNRIKKVIKKVVENVKTNVIRPKVDNKYFL
jgi:gas vesicle protein